jgi:conjugative transfer signal peptidase TraF
VLAGSLFFTVNYSPSFPLGIYRNVAGAPRKGDMVRFCPEDTEVFRMAKERGYITGGHCPGDYGFLIKKILAAKADAVEFTADGIYINGIVAKNSKPKERDFRGRPMPVVTGAYTLDADEVLLLSDHPASFDARYYGITKAARIETAIKPFCTW